MIIACWETKATHTFRVCNTYSFPTAVLVARALPDFGNTFIACSLLLIGRRKPRNNMCFLKYIILLWTVIAITSPRTKNLPMIMDLPKSVIFAFFGFPIYYIKFFYISCSHSVL